MTFPANIANPSPAAWKYRKAFTLLEVLGVLVVLAILAATLVPFLIRSIDRIISENETATLNRFETALLQSISRLGYITNASALPDQIAVELGLPVAKVSTNARRQPRLFLADPALQVNGGGLPYTQTDAGARTLDMAGQVSAPVNPRLLILSSLGSPLPSVAASDFDVLWNTTDGTLPESGAFRSWKGEGSDLVIKRIYLFGLFVRLVLSTYNSQPGARYSLGGAAYEEATPVPAGTTEAFFLQGSVLLLYHHDGRLDSKQVLARDCSFVYDGGVWRSGLDAVPFEPGLDLRGAASHFLGVPPNRYAAPNSSPSNVVQAIINYFDAYDAWAVSNFTVPALKSTASAAQADMMASLQGLYMVPNAPLEEACP